MHSKKIHSFLFLISSIFCKIKVNGQHKMLSPYKKQIVIERQKIITILYIKNNIVLMKYIMLNN